MKKLQGEQLELFDMSPYVGHKLNIWPWLKEPKDQPSLKTRLNVRSIKQSQ